MTARRNNTSLQAVTQNPVNLTAEGQQMGVVTLTFAPLLPGPRLGCVIGDASMASGCNLVFAQQTPLSSSYEYYGKVHEG